jgi:hypothetical protein
VTFLFGSWVYRILRSAEVKRIIEIHGLFYGKMNWEHK